MSPGGRKIAMVPALNEEESVAQVVEELRREAPGFDVLVVDDGSTDATAGLLAGFCREEPRARVLTQPNGGPSRARNAGIAARRRSPAARAGLAVVATFAIVGVADTFLVHRVALTAYVVFVAWLAAWAATETARP